MKTKLLLLFLIIILIALGWYSYNRYFAPQKASDLPEQPLITSTPLPNPSATSAPKILLPSPTPFDPQKLGIILGSLGFPAEEIPELDVYAINVVDPELVFSTQTKINANNFVINNIIPGIYHVVAYDKNNPSFSGGFTEAVACGLSVDCTDHSLINVQVKEGVISSGIEVKDWYAPTGTFPAKPQ